MRFVVRALASAAALCALTAQTPPPTLGVPNTNPKPPATSPVQVESCKLATHGGEVVAKTGDLEIQFTNESSVIADVIRFKVTWNGDEVAYIRDAGKFSPGITVKHKFRQSEGQLTSPLFARPKVRCAVETVHFVDGSIWTNPNAGRDESSATQSSH